MQVPHETITRHGLLRLVRRDDEASDEPLQTATVPGGKPCHRCAFVPEYTSNFCVLCGAPTIWEARG